MVSFLIVEEERKGFCSDLTVFYFILLLSVCLISPFVPFFSLNNFFYYFFFHIFSFLFSGMLFSLFSITYIIAPHSNFGQTMRKPFIKFICHSASYFTFLCTYFNNLIEFHWFSFSTHALQTPRIHISHSHTNKNQNIHSKTYFILFIEFSMDKQ